MSFTSKPRAATSVATSTRDLLDRNWLFTYDLLPQIAKVPNCRLTLKAAYQTFPSSCIAVSTEEVSTSPLAETLQHTTYN